jgi:hypothetical protein
MILYKFEKNNQALATKGVYLKRVLKNILFAFSLILEVLFLPQYGF